MSVTIYGSVYFGQLCNTTNCTLSAIVGDFLLPLKKRARKLRILIKEIANTNIKKWGEYFY